MDCSGCGVLNVPGARFCSACGQRLAPSPVPFPRPHPRAAFAAPSHGRTRGVLVCPHCGQRTVPMAYFSRGVNVAKAAALLIPLNVIGPLVFFFLRKDRFICGDCQGVLPLEAPTRLLEAFSSSPALGRGSDEEQLVRAEASFLERSSRRNRLRGWTLGALTAGLVALGGTALLDENGEAATVLFGSSALAGAGAAVTNRRSRQQREAATAKLERQNAQKVIALAREHAGELTVTNVAMSLGLDFKEAEALLDGLVDGRRVDVQVDGEGRVTYVFPELRRALGPGPG